MPRDLTEARSDTALRHWLGYVIDAAIDMLDALDGDADYEDDEQEEEAFA